MRLTPISAVLIILALAVAAPAGAFTQPSASDQPIHVVSDRLEVDNKAQVAHFFGSVKATQGDVTITCDTLEVYYDREAPPEAKKEGGTSKEADSAASKGSALTDEGGQVRMVVALGHVKVTQKDRVAVGRKATYWAGDAKSFWRDKQPCGGVKTRFRAKR